MEEFVSGFAPVGSVVAFATAIFIVAFILERLSEYVIVDQIDRIYSIIKRDPEAKMSAKARQLLVSLIIFVLFLLFFYQVDFLAPIMAELGITLAPWQSVLLSALLVTGGSNFVHETLFKGSAPNGPGEGRWE
jgi:hypothetical protein